MTLRVLVVGTGFGGRVVAPVFAAIPGCEVVGVVGARDESAIVDALRSTRPDLVSIQSPPFLHRRHVELALGHGVRGVLCDKPFGIDAAESEAMLTAARSSGVVHLVNFEFRCDPLRRQLRDLVRSDRLGPIEHIVWTHWSSGSRVPLRPYGWLFDRSRGGGWIGAWGAHAIDTLRWLLDDELAVVTSVPRTVIAERPDTDGMQLCTAEDSMTAVLRSVRGTTTITIDSSFAHPVNIAPRLVVLGASVELRSTRGSRTVGVGELWTGPGRTSATADELWRLFDAQVPSRHTDLAARWLRGKGLGYYTIGSSGHESNAAVAMALRPTDPALLHYRSGGFYLARAGVEGVRDILAGVVAAADEPIAGGRHKVFGRHDLAVIPQTSTIASHLPRAVGVAFAIGRADRKSVV